VQSTPFGSVTRSGVCYVVACEFAGPTVSSPSAIRSGMRMRALVVLAAAAACSACAGEYLGSAPVTGRVEDSHGVPIQGVRVSADRSATVSDRQGNLQLDVIEQRVGGPGCAALIEMTLEKEGCPTQHGQPSRGPSRQDFLFTCDG
jgi:hypothetical protein